MIRRLGFANKAGAGEQQGNRVKEARDKVVEC